MPNFRTLLLGRRLASEESHETRISNPIALAVFSSDALSSVAYGTQEIMAPLTAALAIFGAGVLGWSWWVAIGIVGLLLVLNVSYRQTIHAYPSGGGAYLVAKDNLGEVAAQTAGASLLIDYILTVPCPCRPASPPSSPPSLGWRPTACSSPRPSSGSLAS